MKLSIEERKTLYRKKIKEGKTPEEAYKEIGEFIERFKEIRKPKENKNKDIKEGMKEIRKSRSFGRE